MEYLGTCKFFDEAKGWGFVIHPEVKADIFVHYKHIGGDPKAFKTLVKNELVLFEITDTSKGLMAVNVRKIPHEGNGGTSC
jgi:CspA family cold shock protein